MCIRDRDNNWQEWKKRIVGYTRKIKQADRGQKRTRLAILFLCGLLLLVAVSYTHLAEKTKRYMHHYNFPSYSVGETRPSRGPGRREIGHGALAELSLIHI